METVQAGVVGGHNGRVAAAYLAHAGWRVRVVGRNFVAVGAIATEDLTLPDSRHDVMSVGMGSCDGRSARGFLRSAPRHTSSGVSYHRMRRPILARGCQARDWGLRASLIRRRA